MLDAGFTGTNLREFLENAKEWLILFLSTPLLIYPSFATFGGQLQLFYFFLC
jgi:hypothetical protein